MTDSSTTTDYDLLYSDVEQDLRSSVRGLLSSRCSNEVLTGMYDSRPGPDGLWKAMTVDLGLAGLLVPEDRGGVGATARETAVVAEEIGRAVAPVPFLTSSVIATTLLNQGGELLTSLASGERTAALVVPFTADPYSPVPTVTREGDGLIGEVRSVAGALDADVLLVPVVAPDGIEIWAVDPERATRTPVSSLDMTRQLADITLASATGEIVVPAAEGEASVRAALLAGAALLASEQVGLAQKCLDDTLAYLKDRRQFGRVVGGFQALKHRLADLYMEVESAGVAARYAAAALADGGSEAELGAALAQAYCGDTAVHVAEESLQLHGGIGMTWEHPIHLYLKRAKADQLALGSPGRHRRRVGELVDLAPPQ